MHRISAFFYSSLKYLFNPSWIYFSLEKANSSSCEVIFIFLYLKIENVNNNHIYTLPAGSDTRNWGLLTCCFIIDPYVCTFECVMHYNKHCNMSTNILDCNNISTRKSFPFLEVSMSLLLAPVSDWLFLQDFRIYCAAFWDNLIFFNWMCQKWNDFGKNCKKGAFYQTELEQFTLRF